MRFVLLDLIRIIAVFVIVVYHFLQLVKSPLGFLPIGSIAVSVLIILSGLCLALNYENVSFWNFFKKRLKKIYPIYWTCFLTVLAGLFISKMFGLFEWVSVSDPVMLCSLAGFCEYAGLQNFIPVGWFIGLIVLLYACFPFIERRISKNPLETLVCLAAVSVFFRTLLYSPAPLSGADWFPLSRVFEFGLGIFLARKIPVEWFDCLEENKTVAFLGGISIYVFLLHYSFFSFLRVFI